MMEAPLPRGLLGSHQRGDGSRDDAKQVIKPDDEQDYTGMCELIEQVIVLRVLVVTLGGLKALVRMPLLRVCRRRGRISRVPSARVVSEIMGQRWSHEPADGAIDGEFLTQDRRSCGPPGLQYIWGLGAPGHCNIAFGGPQTRSRTVTPENQALRTKGVD